MCLYIDRSYAISPLRLTKTFVFCLSLTSYISFFDILKGAVF